MNLKNLSDEALLKQTREVVARERDATLVVLHHLREVERRQIFALKHLSLFDYAVDELGYDKGSAHLRISAMRLLRELPEFEDRLEAGSLNLTLLSQAQSFIHKEEIRDPEAKRAVLQSIDGKSTRDAQRELMSQTSTPERHLPEKVRAISDTHSEIRLVVDEALLEQLKELQALLAHAHPRADLRTVIAVAVRGEIARRTPKAPKTSTAHEGIARQSQAEIERVVWHRDDGRCGYIIDAATGRVCGSSFAIEYDHILPKALGGQSTPDNLRLRCRPHNRHEAIQVLGRDQIAEFVPAMRDAALTGP
jgi:5-methylcytosine-specific restriction endonuclease McrA